MVMTGGWFLINGFYFIFGDCLPELVGFSTYLTGCDDGECGLVIGNGKNVHKWRIIISPIPIIHYPLVIKHGFDGLLENHSCSYIDDFPTRISS